MNNADIEDSEGEQSCWTVLAIDIQLLAFLVARLMQSVKVTQIHLNSGPCT